MAVERPSEEWLAEDNVPVASLHDAEIIKLRLERGSGDQGSTLDMHVMAVENPARPVIRLLFTDVGELELAGWNEQNVLFDIVLREAPEERIEVEIQSSYGLAGRFHCSAVAPTPG